MFLLLSPGQEDWVWRRALRCQAVSGLPVDAVLLVAGQVAALNKSSDIQLIVQANQLASHLSFWLGDKIFLQLPM